MNAVNKSEELYNQSRVLKIRNFFKYSIVPLPLLYLGFWLIDAIYAPELKFQFLYIRVSVLCIMAILYLVARNQQNLRKLSFLGLFYCMVAALGITAMGALGADPYDPYYAGLNLVALAAYVFFPQTKKTFAVTTVLVYFPYFALIASGYAGHEVRTIASNLAFIIGTIVMGALLNVISHFLEKRVVDATIALEDEVAKRGLIIEKKTKEGLALERLSSQFSPQVIQAIKEGSRKLDGSRRRAEICAIFIDVVKSTERLARLDHKVFVDCIEKFVEISINILLKYDLTIDKFYGDGVLAFSNDPLQREDFVERTCNAALEIKEALHENQKWFRLRWKQNFEITVGIARGFASVGFYGNTSYIKQYSAVGPCLPLSQRLSSVAKPNQILISPETYETIKNKSAITKQVGEYKLKGFEDDIFVINELIGFEDARMNNQQDVLCPSCFENSLYIDEVDGVYVMRCRSCNHLAESADQFSIGTKKSA